MENKILKEEIKIIIRDHKENLVDELAEYTEYKVSEMFSRCVIVIVFVIMVSVLINYWIGK